MHDRGGRPHDERADSEQAPKDDHPTGITILDIFLYLEDLEARFGPGDGD